MESLVGGLCECGCGEPVRRRFVPGHNVQRSPCGTVSAYKRGCHCDDCRAAAVAQNRTNKWKVTYGISEEQYHEMLDRQGGVCAICGGADKLHKFLSVDHDHTTGRVRGLLCSQCNRALGLFGDDSSLLRSALDYL